MSFSVRVEGIRFDAAHFATFDGGCEPLHGHGYEVAAEVEGELGEDSWVTDFTHLKAFLRGLCAELDHRFILQTASRLLQVDRSGSTWNVRTPAGLGYVFPVSDVAALPIDNTTAERLAEYLSGRLLEYLSGGGEQIARVAVEVWEGPGQRAKHVRQAGGNEAEGRLPLD